jgi:hypothetical protein
MATWLRGECLRRSETMTSSTDTPGRPTPTVVRWLALIEQHGGHTAALEALIRQADELQKLKRAVRALGCTPESLMSEPT